MRKRVLAVVLMLLSSGALADEKESGGFVVLERWKCYPDGYFMREYQYTLLDKRQAAASEHVYGTVTMRGEFFVSHFEIDGVDRVWDFGEEFEYSFVMKPGGNAAYYDFRGVEDGEKLPPTQIYRCSQS